MLGGCAGSNRPASVSGGECRVFERPTYVVLGKTQHDQDWIDGNVEAGIGACGWPRPQPRPKDWDIKTAAAEPPRASVAAEKIGRIKHLRQKVARGLAKAREKVTGKAYAAPVSAPGPVPYIAPSISLPVTAQPPEPSPSPLPPQDPVDALLHPRK